MSRWEIFPSPTPDDAYLLGRWRDRLLTFTPTTDGRAHPADQGWKRDHKERRIGQGAALFAAARRALLRYEFYPPKVMTHTSDFARAGRLMRPGDSIVIRVHILRPFGLPLLDTLAQNRISRVIDQPRHALMAYITTTAHAEVGEWSAAVEHRPDDSVWVVLRSISRTDFLGNIFPVPQVARFYQKRAHRLGLGYFAQRTRSMEQTAALARHND